ncbi:hypothetical protein [Deinococcus multiflagellatus]|uniref:Nuclear transport factor 2 family protein n=1 Tax=Deinococcus multiflagellatus TaxID=1656887 RepID=A0ABW1ZPZ6_9DEIO|nr:hypothetical protein [Deinococcus multiflagellatus]MBZ9715820.1 hypothetical protein [Deinococcus multiflagellatus]
MKRLILLALALMACRPAPAETLQQTKGSALLTPEQLNQLILDRLAQSDFQQIDRVKFYGPGSDQEGTRSYVSKLSRDEVLGIFAEMIEPHVVDMRWAEDYGQFHGTFRVKSDPKMLFGLAVSFIKEKTDTFKAAPEILKENQSDIVYTPPVVWDEP